MTVHSDPSMGSANVLELLVLADDRTGALETAGAIADAGLPSVMVPFGAVVPLLDVPAVVIDLGSRRLQATAAAGRAVAAFDPSADRVALKIDSTLQGNWATELLALHEASKRPALVVAAFPRAGRVCVGGVVYRHGVPVGEGPADIGRCSNFSSRPAEHLTAAGASSVQPVTPADAHRFVGVTPMCVADSASDEDLAALGELWVEHSELLLAGTASTIGAGTQRLVMRSLGPRGRREAPVRLPGERVLVVCGSMQGAARRQVAALTEAGWAVRQMGTATGIDTPGRLVITTPNAEAPDLTGGRAAEMLGRWARELLSRHRFDVVVVMGGDTAAATLGETVLRVTGTLAPGVAVSRALDDPDGPVIVTKPGGFGDSTTILDLFTGRVSS